jgi:protein transport protein SEC61 subunit gamma-like protein
VLKLLSNVLKKIKEALENYKRVLIIARKPDKEEFIKAVKICLIGIGLIGFIGFIIYTFSILFLS